MVGRQIITIKKVSEKKMQQHALHYEVCSFCQLKCDVLDIFAHVAQELFAH